MGALATQLPVDNVAPKGKGTTQGRTLYLASNDLEGAVNLLATLGIGPAGDAARMDEYLVEGLSLPMDARTGKEGANAKFPVLPDVEFFVPAAYALQELGAKEHASGVERGGEQLGGWRGGSYKGALAHTITHALTGGEGNEIDIAHKWHEGGEKGGGEEVIAVEEIDPGGATLVQSAVASATGSATGFLEHLDHHGGIFGKGATHGERTIGGTVVNEDNLQFFVVNGGEGTEEFGEELASVEDGYDDGYG